MKVFPLSSSAGNGGTECVRVLVGCKSDLEEEREVSEVMIMINIITITIIITIIIIIIISRSLKCKDKRLQRRWSPGTRHLM